MKLERLALEVVASPVRRAKNPYGPTHNSEAVSQAGEEEERSGRETPDGSERRETADTPLQDGKEGGEPELAGTGRLHIVV